MLLTKLMLLLVSATGCIGLMLWHSWAIRGRRITLWFFGTSIVYAILRGHAVRHITEKQWSGSIPYLFSHQTLSIAGEPIMAIVGWVFTIYLSWCLAEKALERLRIDNRNLFALVCFACLSTVGVCYVVEAAADSAHWWSWSLSMKNAIFVAVPTIGVIDWTAIITDFLMPFLLFFLSPVKNKHWKWLLFLPFAIHMLSHTPYQFYLPVIGYFFSVTHVLIFLLPVLLALRNPHWARLEPTASVRTTGLVLHAPLLITGVLLAVTFGMQVKAGLPALHLISFGPIVMMGLLAFLGMRVMLVGGLAAFLLGLFHDPRWLVALAIPIVAMVFHWALSEPKRGHVKNIVYAGAVGVALLACWSEYRFEERCIAYEEGILQPIIQNPPAGNGDSLERQCRAVAEQAPADTNYLTSLAGSLNREGVPVPVVAALYERLIEMDPDFTVAYSALAALRTQSGNHEEALRLLEEARRRAPWDQTVRTNLDRLNQALAKSAAGREKLPSLTERAARAEALNNSGRYEEAAALYLELVEQEPNNPVFRVNLGSALFESGDLPQALYCTNIAKDLIPASPVPYYNLGLIHLSMGDSEASLEAYRAALTRDKDKALIQSALSDLAKSKERITDASAYTMIQGFLASSVP